MTVFTEAGILSINVPPGSLVPELFVKMDLSTGGKRLGSILKWLESNDWFIAGRVLCCLDKAHVYNMRDIRSPGHGKGVSVLKNITDFVLACKYIVDCRFPVLLTGAFDL